MKIERRRFIGALLACFGMRPYLPIHQTDLVFHDYSDESCWRHPIGRLMNLDTGQEIKHACFFDVRTGEWRRYLTNAHGRKYMNPDGSVASESGFARIVFIQDKRCPWISATGPFTELC